MTYRLSSFEGFGPMVASTSDFSMVRDASASAPSPRFGGLELLDDIAGTGGKFEAGVHHSAL